MAPVRGTRPTVGRRLLVAQATEGETMDPRVSVPMENATPPAAVAEAEPAEDPLEPRSRSHGLRVRSPYQTSPMARAPRVSLAMRTAPASSSRRTTVAVPSNT